MKAIATLGSLGLVLAIAYVGLCGVLVAPQIAAPVVIEDAQPIPPQPTVAMPPPQAQAEMVVNWGGPSTLFWTETALVTVLHADVLVRPDGAEVERGPHAGERHTEEEAEAVRQAVAAAIAANPVLGGQPPCKDGRHRFIVPMGKAWGVWVMQQVGEGLYQEITAFKTSSQEYVRGVHDDCGNGDFFGHAYAQ
jgi:hypothetical protein